MGKAERDDNQVTTIIGVSNADGITPVTIYVDPTTHRVLVSLPFTSVFSETPSGAINGANPTFTLAAIPNSGTLRLYHNQGRMREGVKNDYTLSGAIITMNFVPETSDTLLADYQT